MSTEKAHFQPSLSSSPRGEGRKRRRVYLACIGYQIGRYILYSTHRSTWWVSTLSGGVHDNTGPTGKTRPECRCYATYFSCGGNGTAEGTNCSAGERTAYTGVARAGRHGPWSHGEPPDHRGRGYHAARTSGEPFDTAQRPLRSTCWSDRVRI